MKTRRLGHGSVCEAPLLLPPTHTKDHLIDSWLLLLKDIFFAVYEPLAGRWML